VTSRYDALITLWATLTGTTDAKLAIVNAKVVTGVIPSTFYVAGADVLNAIDWTEFNALATTKQLNILTMCACPGPLLGGSANTTHLVPGMIIANFTSNGTTMAGLIALAKAATTPWWQASVANGGGGLSSPVSGNDLVAAGGLT